MEFLSLSRRHSSLQNIPRDEERGETAVFAGYPKCCSWVTGKTFFLKIIILLDTLDFTGVEHWSLHDFSHNTALIVTGQIKFWLKKILLFLEVKIIIWSPYSKNAIFHYFAMTYTWSSKFGTKHDEWSSEIKS